MWRFINKQGIEIIPCEYFEDTLDDEIVVNWDEIENEELRERNRKRQTVLKQLLQKRKRLPDNGSLFFLSLFILHQSADVFADDVELKVDHRAYLDIVEIGILKGVRDDGYLEGVISGVAHCETDTIHRN